MNGVAGWMRHGGAQLGIFQSAALVLLGFHGGAGAAGNRSAGPADNCRSRENVQVVQDKQKSAGAAGAFLRGAVVIAGIMLAAACSRQVEPETRTVRVEVPVQVPCRAPEIAVPPWAAAGLRKTDSLEVKVRALLAERRQRIGYERLLESAAGSCR
ncbi:hypothetical protein D3C81_730030 [compost metagenome]